VRHCLKKEGVSKKFQNFHMPARQTRTVTTYNNRPFRKPRVANAAVYKALPRRTYARSRVPLASRGWKFNNSELKVSDAVSSTYAVNTTGLCTPLCIPQLGSDMNMRIGRKIMIKSVYIRGFCATAASLTIDDGQATEPTLLRFIIFIDDQPNGTPATPAQVLSTVDATSQLNLNNRDRFKVVSDKTFIMGPWALNFATGYASAPSQIHPVKKFKSLNLETIFNGTSTGNISDIASGALYMMWIGTGTGDSASRAIVSTRVRYSDT